jgi:long-subunit acyl-CoA synthetase (AMP-forming)
VSYLPLSHVAAQFSDIVSSMMEGIQVFFADPSALQGTLIQTLQEVRPKIFFSVPRVWEKIYDKMMEIAKENGYIKGKIGRNIYIQPPGPNQSDPKAHSIRVGNSLPHGSSNWQRC